jgi:membrane protein
MITLADCWPLCRDAFRGWNDAKAPRLGAALAYYTVLSLSPLLVLLIALTGTVFGTRAASGELVEQIESTVGRPVGVAVQELIKNAHQADSLTFASVASFAVLVFGAMGVFGQLQDAMNTIWGVKPQSGWGIGRLLRDRCLSFAVFVGTCFLLLVSLVVSAALALLSGSVATPEWLPGSLWLWQLVQGVVSFVVITALFALMLKVLPAAQISWRDVWLSATLTALLFTLGKHLLGFYIAHASVASSYGAAGSLVVLLVWIYYTAQIFLYGTAFTRAYAERLGSLCGKNRRTPPCVDQGDASHASLRS